MATISDLFTLVNLAYSNRLIIDLYFFLFVFVCFQGQQPGQQPGQGKFIPSG